MAETLKTIKAEIEKTIKNHQDKLYALEQQAAAAREALERAEEALASADPTAPNFDAMTNARISAGARAELLESRMAQAKATPAFTDAEFTAIEGRINAILRKADEEAVVRIKAALKEINAARKTVIDLDDPGHEVFNLALTNTATTQPHIYGDGGDAKQGIVNLKRLGLIFEVPIN